MLKEVNLRKLIKQKVSSFMYIQSLMITCIPLAAFKVCLSLGACQFGAPSGPCAARWGHSAAKRQHRPHPAVAGQPAEHADDDDDDGGDDDDDEDAAVAMRPISSDSPPPPSSSLPTQCCVQLLKKT